MSVQTYWLYQRRFRTALAVLLLLVAMPVLSSCSVGMALSGGDPPPDLSSPLIKAPFAGFHPMAKHIAAKAVSPSSETMRTI